MKKSCLGLCFMMSFFLTGCSISSHSSTSNTMSSTSKLTNMDMSTSVMQNFNAIKLSGIYPSQKNGSTSEQVIKRFGEASTRDFSYLDGISSTTLTWDQLPLASEYKLLVSFVDDHAISKSLINNQLHPKAPITLKQFNSITIDSTYTTEKARKEFGEPNGINITVVKGSTKTLYSWTQSNQDATESSLTLTFKNDLATTKSQSNLN